jgi:hypothetical protein
MASTRIISSFQPNCFCPQQIPALFHTTWHFTPGREKVRSSSSLRSPIAVNNTSLSYPPLRPALPHTLPKSNPSGPHPAHRNNPTYYSISPTSVHHLCSIPFIQIQPWRTTPSTPIRIPANLPRAPGR